MLQNYSIPERKVIFFAYVRNQGITEHLCNMALAVHRHTNLLVVYDKRLEDTQTNMNEFKHHDIECVDVSELGKVINAHFKNAPILFHCNGFAHLWMARKMYRPIDKIMLSVHCFRNVLWYSKCTALMTYFLFLKSVDMWHFLCHKSREEYFWYRRIPSNTCVFPLGVEELFMTKMAEPYAVRDIDGKEIEDFFGRVNIVYIARFQPWKRHVFLLRSLQPILKDNVYLILVGEGPALKKIMKLAQRLGVRRNVIFTGRVDREIVCYILSKARLAVTVSPSETFGWCILEPFCMGVPIVTTNVGIANTIINDYHNGFILSPNCQKKDFLKKVKMALKYFNKVDNSQTKSLYLWETFGRSMVKCYDSLFETQEAE